MTLTLGSLLKTVYFPVYVFCSGHSTYYPSSADCVCPVHDLAERMLPDPELPNQNKSSQLPLNGSTHSNTVTRVNIIHQCLLSQLREGLFISIALFHHRRLLQIMIQNNVSCRCLVWLMVCQRVVTVSSVCWSFVDGCVRCPGRPDHNDINHVQRPLQSLSPPWCNYNHCY